MNAIPRSLALWQSPIGKKFLVAATGAFLAVFLASHMAGNLLVYLGPKAFNDYAEILHQTFHGGGMWIFRSLMLVAFAVHISATISLTRHNRSAREPYQMQATIQAPRSSRTMIWSGLTILAFLVYHLLHFTVHAGNDYGTLDRYRETVIRDGAPLIRPNPWQMVIDGFSVWYVSLFYIVAMTLLASHLSHGVQSVFQTLGLRSKKSARAIDLFSAGFAAVIWLGFISIPVAINLFGFGR